MIFVQSLPSNQAVVQKYLTTGSYRETVKSLLLYGVAIIVISTLLSLLGVLLFAFYETHLGQLAGLKNPDALVPFYVTTRLSRGLAGLVMASLFAGAMSTVSASLNALATSSVVDIYRRVLRTDKTDEHYTFASRAATLFSGLAATFGALFAGQLGHLVTASAKIQSELAGLLLGIFIVAVATTRVNGTTVLAGSAIGLVAILFVSAYSSISIFFFPAIGRRVTVGAAYLTNCLMPRSRQLVEETASR